MSLNDMGRATCHYIRAAYVVMAVAAFCILVAPLYGYFEASAGQVLLNIGIAVLLVASKRKPCRVFGHCKRDSSPA